MSNKSTYRHLYRVTTSTHPDIEVGKLLIDKGRLLVRHWDFYDLPTGTQTGFVAGKRLNRLCLKCHDRFKRATENGHPGECGPDVPPVVPSDEPGEEPA